VTGGKGGAGGNAGAGGGAGTTGGKGGAGGVAGTTGAGGAAGAGGTTTTAMCGTTPVNINMNPFACGFGWGATNASGRPNFLDFVSTWVGDEANGGLTSFSATATNNACQDCQLVQQVASGSSMVVFYAYFIGFQACKVGTFCDCNTDTDGHTLCTDGAQWIRNNRATIVNMYGQYAKKVYSVSPNKPVIWWLEGDFIQYSDTTQSMPLSYAELGSLSRDITCAIKLNEPNAIVAVNHSPWITNDQSTGFWGAQPMDVVDMVWVQGQGNTGTLPNSGSYNAQTATYTWLWQFTGRPIMAETSYAGAGADDLWTTTSAANIDARITSGVIGVNVVNPNSNLQSAVQSLTPQLASTCQ
jgi:hypothetical protein